MKRFLVNNFVMLFLMNAGSVFNYAFQILLGRGLTPEQYGLFNSINSFGAILAVEVAVMSYVLAKFTIKSQHQGDAYLRGLIVFAVRWLSVLGIVVFVVLSAASPLLRQYLHVGSDIHISLMIVTVSLSVLSPIPLGVFQGLQRFSIYGLTGFIGAFLRVTMVFPLIFVLDWGVNGALGCSLIAIFASLVFGSALLVPYLKGARKQPERDTMVDIVKFAWPTFFLSLGVGSLGSLDVILARHYCLPEDAGFYATAAVLGRIPFFLSSMLAQVLFPEAVKALHEGESARKSLFISLGLTGVLAGGIACVCWGFSRFIIVLCYGEGYAPAAPVFGIISVAMAFLALSNTIFSFFLAQEKFSFLLILGLGLGGLLVGTYFFHAAPMSIALTLLFSTLGMAILSVAWLWGSNSHRGSQQREVA